VHVGALVLINMHALDWMTTIYSDVRVYQLPVTVTERRTGATVTVSTPDYCVVISSPLNCLLWRCFLFCVFYVQLSSAFMFTTCMILPQLRCCIMLDQSVYKVFMRNFSAGEKLILSSVTAFVLRLTPTFQLPPAGFMWTDLYGLSLCWAGELAHTYIVESVSTINSVYWWCILCRWQPRWLVAFVQSGRTHTVVSWYI